MSKNPFMTCKSRKRRKKRAPVPKPQNKLFCPRTMIRYDNTATGYETLWVCKMCLKSLLSEEAVKSHIIDCNTKTKKQTIKQEPKKDELPHYICGVCNKVFSRSVTLKRHQEEHQKPSSDLESEESDNEMADNNKDVEMIEAANIKGEYADESEELD